jgi:hypothetical protein
VFVAANCFHEGNVRFEFYCVNFSLTFNLPSNKFCVDHFFSDSTFYLRLTPNLNLLVLMSSHS